MNDRRTDDSVRAENLVREVVAEAVRLDGVKRGLWRAAQALGVSERWVKALHYGEPARIGADTYLRAQQAKERLLAARRAELLRELAEIDASLRGRAYAGDDRIGLVGAGPTMQVAG